jgi:hypothetical protein
MKYWGNPVLVHRSFALIVDKIKMVETQPYKAEYLCKKEIIVFYYICLVLLILLIKMQNFASNSIDVLPDFCKEHSLQTSSTAYLTKAVFIYFLSFSLELSFKKSEVLSSSDDEHSRMHLLCMISGFCCDVDEICTLLRYYAS